MLEDTQNKEGGYTIEHGGTDVNVGTPLSKRSTKTDPSPLTSSNSTAKSKKKFSEKKKPMFDKTTKVMRKTLGGPGRKAEILPRHRALLAEIPKHDGKITAAMIALRYSDKVAKNPRNITGTQSWQMLMDEHLPPELIAERHTELLNKRARRNIRNDKGEIIKYDVDDGPDTPAVVKALELAYKLRGSFAAEKPKDPSNVIYNLFYKPEVREAMNSFEQQLKDQIKDEANSKTKNAVYSEVQPGDDGK